MPPVAATVPDRVALLFSSLGGGGVQRVMLTLAEGFLARGLQVDLLIVNARGALAPLVPPRARVVDLRARHAWRALPRVVAYLRRQRPAAVLASQTHVNLLAIVARSMAGARARVVVSEHVAMDAVVRHVPGWKERVFPLGARLCYPRADAIVVVSHATAARLAKATGLPLSRATVIHNPVVTPGLLAEAAMPVSHPWFAEPARPVILAAGRLTRQKDHATLLRAFAFVRARVPARLLILGEGEERPALEALIDDLGIRPDVELTGFVLNPFAYMARARLFVLSSRWEGFGNVLVEAMACGVPVVSTDCPSGPAEILQDGAIGPLVPVGDPPALAEAMLRVLEYAPPSGGLRARAMAFSGDRAVERYLDAMLP